VRYKRYCSSDVCSHDDASVDFPPPDSAPPNTFSSPKGRDREALNKLARAGSVRFFVRQKNGKQWNTVCISCFSFCVDGEKDKLSSRRRFIQSFLRKNKT